MPMAINKGTHDITLDKANWKGLLKAIPSAALLPDIMKTPQIEPNPVTAAIGVPKNNKTRITIKEIQPTVVGDGIIPLKVNVPTTINAKAQITAVSLINQPFFEPSV